MSDEIDELRRMVAQEVAPLRVDPAGYIWGRSQKGGETVVAQVRGWGYLTGHGSGALALPSDIAISVQKAWGDMICDAVNARAEADGNGGEIARAFACVERHMGKSDAWALKVLRRACFQKTSEASGT